MAEPKLPEVDKDPIDLSDDEIDRTSSVFSFDIDECRERLAIGNDGNKIIQGHLFFDHVLNQLLLESLARPKALRLDRMTFSSKVDLCDALGLLGPSVVAFLKRVNKLRNGIAHDLKFEISDQHVQDLVNILPKDYEKNIRTIEENESATRLQAVLLIGATAIDMRRQDWLAIRMRRERGKAQLRNIASRTERWTDWLPGFLKRRQH